MGPIATAAQLEDALRTDLYRGRRAARAVGRARLVSEVAAVDGAIKISPALAEGTGAVDLAMAHRAAVGHAQTFLKHAANEGASLESALRGASWKLDLAATTETATAFNMERELAARADLFRPRLVSEIEWSSAEMAAARGLRDAQGNLLESELRRLSGVERRLEAERNLWELQQRHPQESWFKEWDAALDRRTCYICESNHGKIVPVGQDFPEGEPGAVHPRCRCSASFLPDSWVDKDRL